MMHGSGGMGGMTGSAPGYGYGAGAIEVVLWIAIIAVVAWLAYNFAKDKEAEGGKKALEILNERYAKGEISREEYLRMKQELG